MVTKLLSVALLLLLLPLPADSAAFCAPGSLIGNVTHVRTAERIELGGVFMIRLQGLVAPGVDEPGGSQANAVLRAITLGKDVRCELSGGESYGHCIAICYLDDVDIGEELIREGHARDGPRLSGSHYKLAELEVGERGATISQTFDLPSYCRDHKAAARPRPLHQQRSITPARRVGGKGEDAAEAMPPARWSKQRREVLSRYGLQTAISATSLFAWAARS
jgi:micrococcal nuclease